MFRQCLIPADIFSGQNRLRQTLHLALQAGGKHRQTHDLNQADIFLLDVMQFLMGMIHAQRVFLGGNIVSEGQIQFIEIPSLSGDRRDGVVGLSVRLGKDKRRLIRVASPGL